MGPTLLWGRWRVVLAGLLTLPLPSLCVVRPLGLVAGLAGHRHPGVPESLPQLPPGGPAGQPGAREGAAPGQADTPCLLSGGEERRHLGVGRGAGPRRPPPLPRAHGPTQGIGWGPCPAPPTPRLACLPSALRDGSGRAHPAPHPTARVVVDGGAGASPQTGTHRPRGVVRAPRACSTPVSGRWPGEPGRGVSTLSGASGPPAGRASAARRLHLLARVSFRASPVAAAGVPRVTPTHADHPSAFLLLSRVWDLGAGGQRQEGAPRPCVPASDPALGLPRCRAEFPVLLLRGPRRPGRSQERKHRVSGVARRPVVALCTSWQTAVVSEREACAWCPRTGWGSPVALPGEALDPHVRLTVWGGGDMGWGAPHLLGTGGWGSSHCGRLQVPVSAGMFTCV